MLRVCTTHHSSPLRNHAQDQNLSIRVLHSLVNASTEEKTSASHTASSKKRERSHSIDNMDSNKSRKLFPGTDVSAERKPFESQDRSVKLYSHTFILEYTTSNVVASSLEEFLACFEKNKAYFPLELGNVALGRDDFERRAVALYSARQHAWLLSLPSLGSEENLDSFDFRSKIMGDVLYLANSLHNRFQLNAALRIESIPPDELRDQLLPFRLCVEVSISVLFPGILQPFPAKARNAGDDQESQRRILNFLFPHNDQVPQGFENSIDIRLLFSIVGPAPALHSTEEDLAIQPSSLLPTLLPFQRRSVAWLLSREGKQVSPEGRVVPLNNTRENGLPLFWEPITLEGNTFYLNRIIGQVRHTKPEDDRGPWGGILAEEPGLGKTLECIALLLLNPAIGRNPRTRTWDPIAKVDVREVPVGLVSRIPMI